MPMSGARLKTTLEADILTQIQANFPIPAGLQASEKTALQASQQKLANSIADATGPDVVTEVEQATVTVTVTSVNGVTPGTGTSGPGTGTGTVA